MTPEGTMMSKVWSDPAATASIAVAALFAASLLSACGGSPAELDPATAEELVRERYPDASMSIEEVRADGDRRVAAAELGGASVEFVFVPGEDGSWALEGISEGGEYHTFEELQQISDTMATMRRLARALGSYRDEQGSYPQAAGEELIAALVEGGHLESGRVPAGGEELPVDAWGHPLSYAVEPPEYTLTSAGLDGRRGTDDDIILISGRFVRDP